jgi:hypothetical protein
VPATGGRPPHIEKSLLSPFLRAPYGPCAVIGTGTTRGKAISHQARQFREMAGNSESRNSRSTGSRANVIDVAIPNFSKFSSARILSTFTNPKPFEGIDSKDSYFVQAADFAAGIVTELWERETLVQVVRSFDYVTYNGKRIGEIDAAFITANLHGASRN